MGRQATRRLPAPRAALSDPLFRLYGANFLLSITIYSPILVLFYTGRGLDLFQVFSLEAFTGLATIVLEVPTGVVADRLGLKRSVAFGALLQPLWLVIVMLSHAYWLFLAGYAVLGLSVTFRSGAAEAWIYETLKARGRTDRMSSAQGWFWAASLIGRIVSALLAIVVVSRMDQSHYLLAIGLSAAVMSVATALVLTIPNRQSERDHSGAAGGIRLVRDGIALVRHNPGLRRIVAIDVLTDPLPYALLFLYQPYFQAAGAPSAAYGLAAAAGAGLGAAAAAASHRAERLVGPRRALLAGNLVPVVGYVLMAAVSGPALAPLLYVVSYGAMQLRYPLIATLRNRHIASYNRATAISVIAMLEGAYTLVMKLLVGRLADIDLRLAFLLLAAVPLAATLLFSLRDEHLAVDAPPVPNPV